MKQFYHIFTLLLLLFPLQAKASHIVGGDFHLKHVDGNFYELTFKVFRDCHHGVPPFNNPLFVGMYDKADHSLAKIIEMDLRNDDTLVFVGNNCINIPDGCTHIGLYREIIYLDPNSLNSQEGYYFSWERCCRNVAIKNVYRTVDNAMGSEGIAFYMEIPPLSVRYSSPEFRKNPLTLLCVDNPFSYESDVVDYDGDSLVFSLVKPIKGTLTYYNMNDPNQAAYPIMNSGPYPPIIWENDYSLENIIDGDPSLEIDSETGEITVTPTEKGIYAVAIKVESYRNGELLGHSIRELQFTVSSCEDNNPPEFKTEYKDTVIELFATDHLRLPLDAVDEDQDSVYLTADGDIFDQGNAIIDSPYASVTAFRGEGNLKSRLTWQTGCHHISNTPYKVELALIDNGCPVPLKVYTEVLISVSPPPIAPPPRKLCFDRLNDSTVNVNWGYFDHSYEYFSHFNLYRTTNGGNAEIISTFEDTMYNSYLDKQSYKNHEIDYCYYMTTVNVCGEESNPGYQICTKPDQERVPQISEITSATVVGNQHVKLFWDVVDQPDFKAYHILRKKNDPDAVYQMYYTVNDKNKTSFKDKNVEVDKQSYCYKIMTENLCDYQSEHSRKACNIVLEGNTRPFENDLEWNIYQNWFGGVERYEIKRRFMLDDEFKKIDEYIGKSANTIEITDSELDFAEGAWEYKVIAHEKNVGTFSNDASSMSNTIYLYQKPIVYVPSAFSPNDDYINDIWGIKPIFVKEFKLQVYSRWGELIWYTNDPFEQWDGNLPNEELSMENVFIYQLYYEGWDNSNHYQNGTLTIVR